MSDTSYIGVQIVAGIENVGFVVYLLVLKFGLKKDLRKAMFLRLPLLVWFPLIFWGVLMFIGGISVDFHYTIWGFIEDIMLLIVGFMMWNAIIYGIGRWIYNRIKK